MDHIGELIRIREVDQINCREVDRGTVEARIGHKGVVGIEVVKVDAEDLSCIELIVSNAPTGGAAVDAVLGGQGRVKEAR